MEPRDTDDLDTILDGYLSLLEAWSDLSVLVNDKLPNQLDKAIKVIIFTVWLIS